MELDLGKLTLVSKISVFVLANAVLEDADMNSASGNILKEDTAEDGYNLKDLIFIGTNLNFELHIFA